MTEIQQLTQAIENMGHDPAASQFVQSVFQKDNFLFLKFASQILHNPEVGINALKNCATLISVVLTSSALRPISIITQNYYATMSDEERNQFKIAIIRGLMVNDFSVINSFAHCLALIIFMEFTHDHSLMRNQIFTTFLFELIDKSPTEYAPIGAISSITEIFRVLPPFHLTTKNTAFLKEMIMNVVRRVLPNSDINPYTLLFKQECCKCLIETIKHDLLTEDLCSINKASSFCELIFPNFQIPNNDLYLQLISLMTTFLRALYSRIICRPVPTRVLQEIFVALIEAVKPPFLSVQSENFDMESLEPVIKAIMRMLKTIARFEARKFRQIEVEASLSFYAFTQLGESLFAYLGTSRLQDYFSDDRNSLAYNAYEVLQDFSHVLPDQIMQQVLQLYAGYINSQNPQVIFVALVGAQIALEIRFNEQTMPIYQSLLPLTQAPNEILIGIVYTILSVTFDRNPNIVYEREIFLPTLEVFFNSLSKVTSTSLLKRIFQAFDSFIDPFHSTEHESNLGTFYPQISQMLYGFIKRPDLQQNTEVLPSAYRSLGIFISKLPASFSVDVLNQLAATTRDEMIQLLQQQSLQFLCWYSYVVQGFAKKFTKDQLYPFSAFFELLTSTVELINSTNADVSQNEYVLFTIALLVMKSDPEVSNPFIPRLLNIAKASFEKNNPITLETTALMVGDIYMVFGLQLIDTIPEMIQLLYESLSSHLQNENIIAQILFAVSRMISYGFLDAYRIQDEQSAERFAISRHLGEMLMPAREEFMTIAQNLIPFIPTFAKDQNGEYIFLSMLLFFSAMMDLYLYETTPNPDNTSRHLPSPFIAQYQQTFIDLIKVGRDNCLVNNSILSAFLNYLMSIIGQFDTYNNMNIQIHKDCFGYYLGKALNSSFTRAQAQKVKHIYDNA